VDDPNRRRNVRIEFQALADLKFPERSYSQCQVRDLSLTGIFVIGIDGRGQDEKCEVTLHLSGGSSDVRLTMKAEVVRAETQGLALRFSEIDLDSFIHLKNIVYYNSLDPDILEQEWLASLAHGQK
jgi:c-di-GMP-binding flagellar brake protein YcgR